jgi:Raf kinase inhibitor-like YbhB/YbcL family protein
MRVPIRVLVLLTLAAGCKGGADEDHLAGDNAVKIQLASPAFNEGDTIPRQFTADGKDVSPHLKWGDVPANTKSLALICDDPDAPAGVWVHWVLYNLPADARELPEGLPAAKTLPSGGRQGTNDFGNLGYGGPSPPAGKPHRYYFKLYALDTTLNLEAGAKKADLVAAMKGHVAAEGQLMGRYGR